jgi:glucose-6-phosphate dehydrogenase assembly protein OpcA
LEKAVTGTLAKGAASAVIADVERKLRDLWAEPVAGDVPRSRVCTMNLVVMTTSHELAERYVPVVDEVTRSIPSRAIVVELSPDSNESALTADVSAVCSLEGGRDVCSERIRLAAQGVVCDRVGSAVDALLVPELPTALVWLGRVHVEDPIFVYLASSAHRLVLDTEYTSIQSLMQVARWAREEHGRPFVADLAWTRLAPWQEMCARFFDEPRLREHAMHVTRIAIRQASEPGARLGSEGALLLGWFATRLGWKAKRVGDALKFARPDGATVVVELGAVRRPSGVAPLALARISVTAEHAGVIARGTLERELASGLSVAPPPSALASTSSTPGASPREGEARMSDPPSQANLRRATTIDADMLVWRLDVDLPTATEQRVRLGANRGARLLERTLHRPPNDPTLNEAVAFAEQLLEDGLVCS